MLAILRLIFLVCQSVGKKRIMHLNYRKDGCIFTFMAFLTMKKEYPKIKNILIIRATYLSFKRR
jgi:hypothetical protein